MDCYLNNEHKRSESASCATSTTAVVREAITLILGSDLPTRSFDQATPSCEHGPFPLNVDTLETGS